MIIWLGYGPYEPFVEVGNTLHDPVSWATWRCYSKLARWFWETGQTIDVSIAQDGWGVKIGPP